MKKALLVTIVILAFCLVTFGQSPANPASVPTASPSSTAIPIPEPEAAKLRSLLAKVSKAQAEYKEVVEKAQAALEQSVTPLRDEYDVLLVAVGAKAGLGRTALNSMEPKEEGGKMVLVKREAPKPETPNPPKE